MWVFLLFLLNQTDTLVELDTVFQDVLKRLSTTCVWVVWFCYLTHGSHGSVHLMNILLPSGDGQIEECSYHGSSNPNIVGWNLICHCSALSKALNPKLHKGRLAMKVTDN